MAIEIEFLAKIVNFLRGGKEMRSELSGVKDALEDAGDAGQDAGRDQERALEDVADAAGDTGDSIEDAANRGTDALDGVEQGAGKVGDALGDLGGVAKSALEGDAAGAVEGLGGALSGLAGAIPGIGGLIGAGLGVVVTEWAKGWEETAEENKKTVADMYQDMLDSGQKYLSQDYIQKAVASLYESDDDFAAVKKAADELGLSVATVAEAYVGVPEAMDTVAARADNLADKLIRVSSTGDGTTGSASSSGGQIAYLRSIEHKIGDVSASTDNAAQKARAYDATIAQNAARWDEAGEAASGAFDKLPKDVAVGVSIDTGTATRELENLLRNRTMTATVDFVARYGRPNA